MTSNIRLVPRHLIPLLEWHDVEVMLAALANYNPDIDRILSAIDEFCADHDIKLRNLTSAMVQQLISDLVEADRLTEAVITEGSSVPPITRADAPSGVGITSENVWVTPPGETYILWFFVNGVYKLPRTNYYITSLASLGAESGDVIQIASVIIDEETGAVTVGWMTSAAVP